MFNLGMGEITVILILALIFLGPKKLPELASGLGKLIREIRKTTADVKNEIQLDDLIRKPFEELRDAVTLPPEELKRRDRVRREMEDLQRQAEALAKAAEASAQELAASTATADTQIPANAIPANGIPATNPADVTMIDAVPKIPGAAPNGTVAREPSGPSAAASVPHAPPAPPPEAIAARGSGPIHAPDRGLPGPAGAGASDFLRRLRHVPEGRKPAPGIAPAHPVSAADRSNITQSLSEADLAAITVSQVPPPPPIGQTSRASMSAPAAPLPGATPPKKPEPTT